MDIRKEIFSHPYWIQTSERLKYSADILIKQLMIIKDDKDLLKDHFQRNQRIRSLLETNLMLLGYCIENLLKGLLIYQYKKNNSFPQDCDFDFIQKTFGKLETVIT